MKLTRKMLKDQPHLHKFYKKNFYEEAIIQIEL
jgi:hypothetical protein